MELMISERSEPKNQPKLLPPLRPPEFGILERENSESLMPMLIITVPLYPIKPPRKLRKSASKEPMMPPKVPPESQPEPDEIDDEPNAEVNDAKESIPRLSLFYER